MSKLLIILNTYAEASAFEGGLAQLARAFDWQSKGRGFDSPMLHTANEAVILQIDITAFLFARNLHVFHVPGQYLSPSSNPVHSDEYRKSTSPEMLSGSIS